MAELAEDFRRLLPRQAAPHDKPDHRPAYYLWTFDPTDGKIHIDHNEGRHPAEILTHETLAPEVTHPDRVHGYAYSIVDGWRITNEEGKKIDDPFIVKRVLAALRDEHPPAPLPAIRYHGDPDAHH